MYSIFGADRALKALLSAYAVAIVLVALAIEPPASILTLVRWALISAGLFMSIAVMVAGWPGFHAPWRWTFRTFPKLNEWVYPDLNGVWYGTTKSNWTVIESLREAASKGTQIDLRQLSDIELQEGEIAIEIKASLFRITVRSKVSATGGSSKSLSSRAEKSPETGEYGLAYLYRQETPEPVSTDEGMHEGAATLEVGLGEPMSMRGWYWTRRKWREGMNTAGLIEVRRVSDRHAPRGADLLQHTRKLASA